MLSRAVDIVIGSVALIVCLPLWLVIAVMVRLGSRGPIFFRSARVGQGGQPFMIVKFRTMHVNDGSGPRVTSSSDQRVTRAGRWLRKTKLDETPQLINVLKGEMALVGPRPEDPRYVAQYSRAQREILNYKPGLVGPAVLAFRHEEEILAEAPDLERAYLETILPQKLALDLGYMKERTLRSDLRMLGRTVKVVFSRRDAI